MAQCPDCTADNPQSTKFCKRCGCPLPVSPLPAPSAAPAAPVPGAACPKCAGGLPPGVRFCTACGRKPDLAPPPPLVTEAVTLPPVSPAPVPTPEAPVDVPAAPVPGAPCPKCAGGLPPGVKFCTACGRTPDSAPPSPPPVPEPVTPPVTAPDSEAGGGAGEGAERGPGAPEPLPKKPGRMKLVLLLVALAVVCAAIGGWWFSRSVQPAADAANATQNATGNAADAVANGTSAEAPKPVPPKPTPPKPAPEVKDIKEPKPRKPSKTDLGNHVPPPKGDEKLSEIERERRKLIEEMKLNKP